MDNWLIFQYYSMIVNDERWLLTASTDVGPTG
jgi:hypothetical protein